MTVAEKRQAQRVRLIEAATEAIDSGGLSAFRVKEVAKNAGCSLGQVYTFFEDVDALVVAVNSRTITELDAYLGTHSLSRSDATPEDVLASLAQSYLHFATRRRNAWAALFERSAASGKSAPDWHRAEHLALISRIVEPLEELLPEWSEEQIAALSLSMFSMVHGIVSVGLQETVVSVPVRQLERQLDTVVMALCRGLDRESSTDR
jgi:AcrR family transcriptional regulator